MNWKALALDLRPASGALLAFVAIGGITGSPASATEILNLNLTAATAEGEDYLRPFRETVLFEGYILTITAAEAYLVRNGEYSANVAGIQRYLPGAGLLANATTPTPYIGEPVDGTAAVSGQIGYTYGWNSECGCRSTYHVTGFSFWEYAASFTGKHLY